MLCIGEEIDKYGTDGWVAISFVYDRICFDEVKWWGRVLFLPTDWLGILGWKGEGPLDSTYIQLPKRACAEYYRFLFFLAFFYIVFNFFILVLPGKWFSYQISSLLPSVPRVFNGRHALGNQSGQSINPKNDKAET